jgi:hypothetical protein
VPYCTKQKNADYQCHLLLKLYRQTHEGGRSHNSYLMFTEIILVHHEFTFFIREAHTYVNFTPSNQLLVYLIDLFILNEKYAHNSMYLSIWVLMIFIYGMINLDFFQSMYVLSWFGVKAITFIPNFVEYRVTPSALATLSYSLFVDVSNTCKL